MIIDTETWFKKKVIAKTLEYENTKQAIRFVEDIKLFMIIEGAFHLLKSIDIEGSLSSNLYLHTGFFL